MTEPRNKFEKSEMCIIANCGELLSRFDIFKLNLEEISFDNKIIYNELVDDFASLIEEAEELAKEMESSKDEAEESLEEARQTVHSVISQLEGI